MPVVRTRGSCVTMSGRGGFERCIAQLPWNLSNAPPMHILNEVKTLVYSTLSTTAASRAHLLESHDGRALEAEVSLEVLRDLAHQALERELADQKLSGLLVLADLAESHGARAVAVRFLHSTSGRRRLARRLMNRCSASSEGNKDLRGNSKIE